MAGKNFDPKESGYVEVKDRIAAFYAKYPDGSIQSEIAEISDTMVVMRASAYRDREDTTPGVGHSMMKFGTTNPYTKDSEIENAETSAWGRAIAALGFEVKHSIASAEEVANKATLTVGASSSAAPSSSTPDGQASPSKVAKFAREARKVLGDDDQVKAWVKEVSGIDTLVGVSVEELDALNRELILEQVDTGEGPFEVQN